MRFTLVTGDLLEQEVNAIVNSWNRNIIPWWLLLPQGVSGAIKKRAGLTPFKELAKYGAIPLGDARVTSAGRLPYKAIIHVAGINLFWFGTEYSVKRSVENAVAIAERHQFKSIAIPLIGSGNRSQSWSLQLISTTLKNLNSEVEVTLVQYSGR